MKIKTLTLVIALAITSCATFDTDRSAIERTEKTINEVSSSMKRNGMELNEQKHYINVDDGIWVSTDAEVVSLQIPERLTNRTFDFVEGDSMTMAQICSYLTKRFGVRVKRANELIEKGQDFKSDIGSSPVENDEGSGEDANLDNTGRLNYVPVGNYLFALEGATFSEVLDNISETLGISWKYDAKKGVIFYYYETKYMTVEFSPISREFKAVSTNKSGSDEGDSGGGSSETNQTLTVKLDSDFWVSHESTLLTLISPYGVIDVNRRSGHVVVTDSPDVVEEVEQYVNFLNRNLELEVETKLTVIRFDHSSTDNFTFSISAIYDKVDRALLGLNSPRGAFDNLSSLGLSITDPSSRWNSTELFLDALSTEGDVSVVREKESSIKNFTMFQWKKGEKVKYFETISSTSTPNVGQEQSAEVSEEFLGVGISLYPRIRNKNKVTFDVVFSQNDLVKFETTTIGDFETKLPQTIGEDLMTQVDLKNGQSKVILKYSINKTEITDSGMTGTDAIDCLGGCARTRGEDTEYVLYILSAVVK